MNKGIKKHLLPLLLLFILSACNLPVAAENLQSGESGEDASLVLTITAQALILEQAGQTSTPTATTQSQTIVYVTATPEVTASATPEAMLPSATVNVTPSSNTITVTVSSATNCRTGPGQMYANIYGLPVGEIAEVVGKNTSTDYWIIKIPNGNGTCWLWGLYATVTGDTSALPTVAIPPTPTPTITPKPKVTVTPTPTTALAPAAPSNASAITLTCSSNQSIQDITGTLTWADNSNNETGFNIYFFPNWASGSTDQLQTTVGPNTTSYNFSISILSHAPPIMKVEAVNNAGTSSRVSANVDISSCP